MRIHLEPLPTAVFIVVMLCWFTFAAAFLLRRKPPATKERKRERASLIGILLQSVAYAVVWSARRQMFTPILRVNRFVEFALALLTLALAVGSVWMVIAAVRTLGRQWSLTARVVEGHKLIVAGPYRRVRHPIYTGMFGMLLATGLALTHWLGLLIAIVVFLIGTMIRVRSEEKLLREVFGSEFEDYSRRVPAIFPLA